MLSETKSNLRRTQNQRSSHPIFIKDGGKEHE